MNLSVENKVVIVTGSTSGIGKDVAEFLAENGAKVIVTGRRQSRVDEIVEKAAEKGWNIQGIAVDLTEEGAADKVVDCAVKCYGTVDALINNAGIIDQCYSVTTIPEDIFEDCFKTNVFAPLKLSKKVLPIMLEKDTLCHIINICSITGLCGFRGGPGYTSSKHALVGLTKHMAVYYSNTNIRVNGINPGTFPASEVLSRYADETGKFMKDDDFSKRFVEFWGDTTGELNGQGDNVELARMIAFILSDAVPFMSGASITIDGAWTIA